MMKKFPGTVSYMSLFSSTGTDLDANADSPS